MLKPLIKQLRPIVSVVGIRKKNNVFPTLNLPSISIPFISSCHFPLADGDILSLSWRVGQETTSALM